ncbi:uncharacterized protein LOC109836229 [Asparagus officinalis]|uniref:uncharacterized protein LOC109836229 n=1 Tax=Asparagus officinalis TaxID=4686 RepID=UPI00098E52DE|nr:uncharacterized protein LOC109836229 [Asparagus officinalis]
MEIKIEIETVKDHSIKDEVVTREEEDKEEVTRRTDLSHSVTNARDMTILATNVGRNQIKWQKEKSESKNKDIWYLDSGASKHMCDIKEFFTELNETVQGDVTFGDQSKIPVKGKRKIMIQTKTGENMYISDVYYVPTLQNNILSVGQLLKRGYDIHLKDHALTIKNKNEVIAKASRIQWPKSSVEGEDGKRIVTNQSSEPVM